MKLKKVLADMKNRKGAMKNKVIAGTAGMMTSMFLLSTTVMAAGGVDSVIQPLTNLKTLVVSVIAAVGVIILAKNVMEFATAYQQQDSSSMNSAIKGIVAGLIMAAISSVLAFLGIA